MGRASLPRSRGGTENPDGTYSLLIGYYNRNTAETLDIPVGPNNKIEPGELDQGQPTHFQTGRQWGVFVIKVPKDFGDKSVRWTIEANGERNTVPFTLNKGYPVTPYKEAGMSNSPPKLTFTENGPKTTGPPMGIAAELTGKAGEAIPIAVTIEDDKGIAPSKSAMVGAVSFHKYRGPGIASWIPRVFADFQPIRGLCQRAAAAFFAHPPHRGARLPRLIRFSPPV